MLQVVAKLVLAFCLGLVASLPDVFDDYFDEDVKIVDVSQQAALEACVKPAGSLLNKIADATKTCLGNDEHFDWEDFTTLNKGADTDQNGLTVQLENAEACFYGEMKWVLGAVVKKEAIIEDFANLGDNVKKAFVADVNQCTNWGGELSVSRKRRSVDDSKESLEHGRENVEVNMEVGGSLLGWVKSLVRSKRQVQSGPKKKAGKKLQGGVVKKQPKSKKSLAGARAGQRSIIKKKVNPKAGGSKKKKKKKRVAKGQVKKSPTGPTRTIPTKVYNQLWCFDLAVGRALKTCVEAKIA